MNKSRITKKSSTFRKHLNDDDELAISDVNDIEWPIASLLQCKIERRFRDDSDKQILLHRLVFVAKLGQDITAPAAINFMENTYQRVLEESPNGQPREPITGLGIVYPTQTVVTIEGGIDSIIQFMERIDPEYSQNNPSPFSTVKVVCLAHDITSRIFHSWVQRNVDIAAAIVIGGNEGENAEPIVKTATDLLVQISKLGKFIQECPPEKLKPLLDNLHEKAGSYLPGQDLISTLTATHEKCIRNSTDFIEVFKGSVLDGFKSEVIWPVDLNVAPHNWSLLRS